LTTRDSGPPPGDPLSRPGLGQRQLTPRYISPAYSFALIKLPRVFRHFEAADEVGIARHSAHLIADAVCLLRRQECRPFADELLPHGLFVLNAFREGKIRPALLARICRLTLLLVPLS
jgi:hypothetical protein